MGGQFKYTMNSSREWSSDSRGGRQSDNGKNEIGKNANHLGGVDSYGIRIVI
jgi:hypothetical protein